MRNCTSFEEQHVFVAVVVAELVGGAFTDRADVGVGELLGGRVDEGHAALGDLVADGVHEVCLAETDVRVHDERVVQLAGLLGDGEGGGVGELVGLADDEAVKGVPGVKGRCSSVRAVGRWKCVGRGPVVGFGGRLGSGFRGNGRVEGGFDGEADFDLGFDDAFDGLGDEGVHALLEHLGDECVGCADDELAVSVRQAGGVLQPSVEVGLCDLHLQLAEGSGPKLPGVGGGRDHVVSSIVSTRAERATRLRKGVDDSTRGVWGRKGNEGGSSGRFETDFGLDAMAWLWIATV